MSTPARVKSIMSNGFSKFSKLRIQLQILPFLVVTLFLAACEKHEPKAPKRPQQISDLSGKIVVVAEDEKTDATEIVIQQTKVWNEEAVLFSLASEANTIAKGLQTNFKEIKPRTIRFTMQVPLVDKFGNETMTRVIAINFRTSDIYKINYAQGFELQQLLNLSESVWYVAPISHRLVFAFCKSEPGQYAAEFCRREKKG
jgi:hypothetical protein